MLLVSNQRILKIWTTTLVSELFSNWKKSETDRLLLNGFSSCNFPVDAYSFFYIESLQYDNTLSSSPIDRRLIYCWIVLLTTTPAYKTFVQKVRARIICFSSGGYDTTTNFWYIRISSYIIILNDSMAIVPEPPNFSFSFLTCFFLFLLFF